MINRPSSKQYDEEVRKFALTLQCHSNRAYAFAYVRTKFSKNLPHVSTLRKWYQNSSASGEPGFCTQSFQKLKQLANEQKANGNELIRSLIFDEISTKQNIQWSDCQKKLLGHITFGFRPDGEEVPLANNVIVFMLNGVNVDFTFPVANYFIRSLLAEEKVRLLQDVFEAINACGVRVVNDGLLSNFTMSGLLGASFTEKHFKAYFFLPNDNRKTFITLDPSHMLKLSRNYVGVS